MMWSQTTSGLVATLTLTSSSSSSSITRLPCSQSNTTCLLHIPPPLKYLSLHSLSPFSLITHSVRLPPSSPIPTLTKLRASTQDTLLPEDLPTKEVEKSVEVLKRAAKTRKVPKDEVLSALSVIEKSKLDPSAFLETLGGSESPGRTWMLIFTAEKQFKGGRYFPITAVQRFDAEARRIENGVYLGPLGSLSFEGRLSWKKRILAFIFERIRVKIGPLKPVEVSLGSQDNREPSTKDPFFIWFYVDEQIAVARGRSGGTAFWCRCQRLPT